MFEKGVVYDEVFWKFILGRRDVECVGMCEQGPRLVDRGAHGADFEVDVGFVREALFERGA